LKNHPSNKKTPANFKLTPRPLQAHEVFRMRLVQQINEGVRRKMTVVSAAGGFGKTTAISQWAAQAAQKVAWLSLEKSDNDPGKFLKHFIASLQTVHPDIGKGIFESLQSANKPAMESALQKMLDQTGIILQDFVVALDDYHFITAPPVHNMLSYVLEYLPPQMHLLITSESDPPLPLSLLRASDQLQEIRAPYLAFTMEEAQALFNDIMKLKIPYGDITALVVRTHARPIALKYAALCLRHFPNLSEFVSRFEQNERDEIIFLANILLEKQPEAVRDFLLHISILKIFDAALCNLVTGRDDSEEILQTLSGEGAFITPLDQEEQWFCFHSGIQELLAGELAQIYKENQAARHLRASLGYSQSGFTERAFHHALAAPDFDFAGQLVEEHAQHMLQAGELVTVSDWLNALPGETIRRRPLLSICRAWIAIISQQFAEVEIHLENALSASSSAANPQEIFDHVDAIRAYLAERI
jgi:LuxR family maltose regulon positive regulatory protein